METLIPAASHKDDLATCRFLLDTSEDNAFTNESHIVAAKPDDVKRNSSEDPNWLPSISYVSGQHFL